MGTTPPDGHRHLPPKNGASPQLVELRDAIRDLVSIQTDRHRSDDDWRTQDEAVHAGLISKIAKQSVYIAIGAALVGGAGGWLIMMNQKLDRVEHEMLEKISNLEDELRSQFGNIQVRNDSHHFKRGMMERDIDRNKEAIRDLERRIFGRVKKD